MRLKAHAPVLDGWEGTARIVTDPKLLYYAVELVIDGLGTMDVAAAARADYELMEATDPERTALKSAGYEMRGL